MEQNEIDSYGQELVKRSKRRHQAPEGECKYCDAMRAENMTYHPPHDPSPMCASGRRNHCSCDGCF